MPRVTYFYKRSFRALFQSTESSENKNECMLECNFAKTPKHQTVMQFRKVKTYQSLLFCPAYLFSLEDLKRRWYILTICLEIKHVEYHLSLMLRNSCVRQRKIQTQLSRVKDKQRFRKPKMKRRAMIRSTVSEEKKAGRNRKGRPAHPSFSWRKSTTLKIFLQLPQTCFPQYLFHCSNYKSIFKSNLLHRSSSILMLATTGLRLDRIPFHSIKHKTKPKTTSKVFVFLYSFELLCLSFNLLKSNLSQSIKLLSVIPTESKVSMYF